MSKETIWRNSNSCWLPYIPNCCCRSCKSGDGLNIGIQKQSVKFGTIFPIEVRPHCPFSNP